MYDSAGRCLKTFVWTLREPVNCTLTWGPRPEAPALRIRTLSYLEHHPAGVPGTTLARAILP